MSRHKDYIILLLTATSSYLLGIVSYKVILDLAFKSMEEDRKNRRRTSYLR